MLSRYLKIIPVLQHGSNIRQQGSKNTFKCWRNTVSLIQRRNESSNNELKGNIASTGPFEVELVKGKRYPWCRCGYSEKQPFCDGQHRRYRTGLSPLRFKAEDTGTFLLCGCKQTNNPPFCDGSHNCDEVQNFKSDK